MTPLKLAIHRVMPNSEALWVNDKELWTSVNYIIYYTEAWDSEPQKIANLKTPFLTKELSKLRLATRALRLGVRSFLRLRSGTIIVVANKRLFRLNDNKLSIVYRFDRGIGPLRNGLCEDQKGNLYAGEYFLNNDRAYTVKLLKSMDDGKTWDVIQRMKGIRHIHAVQFDPYEGKLWMATGDRDEESRILFSEDEGASWKELASGSQKFRTVSFLFTDNYIYWGTDAPTIQNHIFRYGRNSKKIEKVANVNGPVYSSATTRNGVLLFSTGNEGKSEGRTAEWDRTARIWASKDGTRWQDLMRWDKDRWPYIFGFGRILFARGSSENIVFTTQCLKGVDETTFIGGVTDGK